MPCDRRLHPDQRLLHDPQMKRLADEKASAETSLKDLASQLNTQRGAAAAEAGDVNNLKQFWQVHTAALLIDSAVLCCPELRRHGAHGCSSLASRITENNGYSAAGAKGQEQTAKPYLASQSRTQSMLDSCADGESMKKT